jgi:Bardet-Biedl syndrome 5 protein
VRIADSKFGLVLVVETSAASGGYVLGFRVDPKETLEYVHKEMSSMLQVGNAWQEGMSKAFRCGWA